MGYKQITKNPEIQKQDTTHQNNLLLNIDNRLKLLRLSVRVNIFIDLPRLYMDASRETFLKCTCGPNLVLCGTASFMHSVM